jgi:hypothetical protein
MRSKEAHPAISNFFSLHEWFDSVDAKKKSIKNAYGLTPASISRLFY